MDRRDVERQASAYRLPLPLWLIVVDKGEMRESNDARGFTVIELVLVIVVVAIIALAAAPRLASITGLKASATARRLQSDLTYTQNLAMTTNRRHRVVFPAATLYEVRDAAG